MKGGHRPGAGRPPAANPRCVAVMVRLTVAEASALDAARGARSRSEWLRIRANLTPPATLREVAP